MKEGLTEKDYAHLVTTILDSNLHEFIIPTQNRNDFIEREWNVIVKEARKLIAQIEAELAN